MKSSNLLRRWFYRHFLLWQIAYSEIYTSHIMWPDFQAADLEAAVADYTSRERRFGLTSRQVRGGARSGS